jgi:hypothetical protein
MRFTLSHLFATGKLLPSNAHGPAFTPNMTFSHDTMTLQADKIGRIDPGK